MSLQGCFRRVAERAASLAGPLGVAAALAFATGPVRAQTFAPAPAPTPDSSAVPSAPGAAAVEAGPGLPVLPPQVQVVQFKVPPGVHVEVLGPPPEPIPLPADGGPAQAVYGLRVGVGYRLRVWDLPGRPGAELFPVVEVVGHLHRPSGIDPVQFPVRVDFGEDDVVDAVDRGRLVTQVVYLEDPDQALPITLPRGEIPVVTLSPVEEPLKVAAALGRVMAIVRIGGRRPTVEELNGERILGAGMDASASARCPFTGADGGPCQLPCGPVRGTPPPPGRPWVPRDEYLCDGGDHDEVAHFGGGGGLMGIDPRDAVVQFSDARRPRILPTNMVCLYAPRFAEVRVSVGPNENLIVQRASRAEKIEAQVALDVRQESRRLVQNQAAELSRERARASAMRGRAFAGVHSELRVLNGYEMMAHVSGHTRIQGPEQSANRQKPGKLQEDVPPMGIKTSESAVVTGIIEGAGQTVMTWTPRETVGVEEPPNRPGLAVIKRVSAGQAQQGDTVTFVIQFRNMGNTPIRAVSIVDSLLPRLEYVASSAQGPKGTVFTAAENRAGSTELRWDLPGSLAPGVEGFVTFQALVR
jgi:uncharacterized repeat protein (TIGR01451 family)